MLLPVGEVVMNLDVAFVGFSTDPDLGVAEIRPSISVRNSNVDDLDSLAVERSQLIEGEILVPPNEVKKALVDVARSVHGNLSKGTLTELLKPKSTFLGND